MIVVDTSIIPMPGKNAECVALVKEAVAYLDQRWPLSPPRMATVDLVDGRVHIIAMRASLAEHEPVQAEQQADAGLQGLLQKGAALTVPGSSRSTYSRVL